MATTLRMRFTPDNVSVEVPEKGYFDSTPNLVVYYREEQTPLSIGESLEAYMNGLRGKNMHLPSNVTFTPALGPEDMGKNLDQMVIEII